MIVLPLIQQYCSDLLPFRLSFRLDGGSDGEVYSIADNPDQVIKLGVIYDRDHINITQQYQQVSDALSYVIRYKPSAYVRVYVFSYLGCYFRSMPSWQNGTQHFLLYYYTMDKLQPLSQNERAFFRALFLRWDDVDGEHNPMTLQETIEKAGQGLDIDAGKVMLWASRLQEEQELTHLDLHPCNIMIDKEGQYRVIDLDRTKLNIANTTTQTKGDATQ